MRLKACINGPRTPAEHNAIPITPDQIRTESLAAVNAGAEAIHLHPKTPDGTDSLAAEHVASAVRAAREAGVPVGVTTGAWSTPDAASRLAAVESWTTLPDFASVNWHEEGAADLARLLMRRGVGVEAGLWTAAAARAWLASGLTGDCIRALLEVQPGDTPDVADELVALTESSGVPLLLHGQDDTCWATLRSAVARGLATRIGLEDTLTMPDGSPATGNSDLVTSALAFFRV